MFKKTILIDLDGVLNTYTGSFDENYIPSIRNGAYDFVKELSINYKVVVFTTRDLSLVSEWIKENRLDEYVNGVTNTKEPCFLIIDDRCINFSGDYSQTLDKINNFKVWYK